MGQGHSTSQAGTDSTEAGLAKKDYYELLEVKQNASPEEIKKAYRRKALELHPDRNYGNVEAATDLFAEIQSAYEVLSDPQERSWYDSHRDAFLGGDGVGDASEYSHNSRMTTSADILKLFSKFSPQMEFSDSPSGFFGGLRETFAQLNLEEEAACYWENLDIVQYPSFGSRDDQSHLVRGFYAIWGNFSTKKSFAWKDVYRYSEAPDRRVRRMMEKENKRLRESAIREFNDAVRSLVAFAKKRDPRYKAYRDSQLQHREAVRQAAASQASKSRAANQAKLRDHVLQDWAASEDTGEYVAESSDEGEIEQFECIVCRKFFKSQNQFQAHERSKKHIKAVKQLRWEMKIQDDELELGSELRQDDDSPTEYPVGSLVAETSRANWNEKTDHCDTKIDSSPSTDIEMESNIQVDASPVHGSQNPDTIDNEADYAPRETLEDRLTGRNFPTPIPMNIDGLSQELSASTINDTDPQTSTKIGKAKQKRAKKAQLAAEKSQTNRCSICGAFFASRNKLFSHIKLHQQR
ncbi:hypothetical protein BDV18DRAFT_164395 [Aspergillus unguis]